MDFSTLKVMVVDDVELHRSYNMRLLRRLGIHDLSHATDGEQALSMIQGGAQVDVVITDLHMPGMDGIELIRNLAERQLVRAVIIASGLEPAMLHSVEKMAHAYGIRVLGTMEKPFAQRKLAELLRKFGETNPVHRAMDSPEISGTALRQALHDGQIAAEFQPKVEFGGGRVVGAEALARWRRADGGMVSPGAFVPVAEREGLVDALTEIILQQSCAQLTEWGRQGYILGVAVNVSMLSLTDVRAADRIFGQVQAAGCNPGLVTLEVTETALLRDAAKALDVLTRLRLKGFRLSIDDFGTGYSSIRQLSDIPFTELKIDRSFVHDCAERPRIRSVVETSLEFARKLSLNVVAEGVEVRADWDTLKSMGCDHAQGWFIAKSMPGIEFRKWLGNWEPPSEPSHGLLAANS